MTDGIEERAVEGVEVVLDVTLLAGTGGMMTLLLVD